MADRVVKYVFQGDIKGLQASMAAAGASVNKFAGDLTKLDKDGAKMRQGLTAVGNTAGKIGLVAAAGLGSAIAVAANFDQAMSNVKAATHETAENMDALREAAIKAGADTAFSASEAAAGIENLAKAGVDTANILGGGLQGALDLAAAGGMEVADAAEAAAGAMAQFKLEGDQVPHIADLLAAAAGKAQGDVSDMVMALKQAGTVSAQTGLTLEETTGALAAMAEQSLLGSDAGTSFKTMLAALTPNSEKAAAAMEQYNIHAFDAQGNFVGMTELAGQLQAGLGDLTDEQRAMTLETIFGSDAVRAASIIYDNGADGIAKWTNEVNDAGYASETAAIRLDNLKGDLEAFKGSLETALIGVGEGSQGPLRELVQGATDVVNAFNKMPAGVQSSVTAVLGATAVLGGGIFVGSKVVQGIADTRDALSKLGIDASKTTRAMKGLAAASAGLAVGFAAAAAIRAIQDATDETLPGVEALTNQLLNINTIGLADEFDSIGESLRRLTDKTFEEKWGDKAFGQMGMVSQFFGVEGVAGSVREATAEIDALDQAFARIAQQGGPEKAMQVFRDFAAAQGLTVSQQRDLLDRMPLLGEAFAGTANDAELAADGIAAVGEEATSTSTAVYTLQNAMDILFGKVDVDAALVSWKNGLAGLKEAVKDNAKTLNVNTQAGRDNRDEIRGNVGDLRTWAEAVYEQTGNLDGLRTRLLKGREAIIAQAEAAGFSKKETEAYLKELGLTPKEIRTDVALIGADVAEDQIDGVQVKLSALDRTVAQATMRARDEASAVIEAIRRSMLNLHDKTIYIRAVHTTSRLGNENKLASGGPVYGPGTATSDSIPAYLSNGEYVVRAAAVDKYGVRMFDQLNAMRFAEGGSVQRAQRSASYTTNNYGPSGPIQISGRLRMDDGRMADITGVIDDRINANSRHNRATGRR